MTRLLLGAILVAGCTLAAAVKAEPDLSDTRSLPMTFEIRREGPPEACGAKCKVWVAAVGAITADTPRRFAAFTQTHDVRGMVLALDSGGGSVRAAMELGRMIRRLEMTTTVGRTVEAPAVESGPRVSLSPHADCESMCAFLLLAGARRHVPPHAGVMVHQIWIGDKRDDPTAVTYSAEDIALIQRDIGKIAQYTAEMGGALELIEIAMRFPPWERMRPLTAEELRRTGLATTDQLWDQPASDATIGMPDSLVSARAPGAARGWTVVERAGHIVLARHHPLTMEGEEIGSFDLSIACGDDGRGYSLIYRERRKSLTPGHVLEPLKGVEVLIGGENVPLEIVSSRLSGAPSELDTLASGVIAADVMQTFAQWGSRSLTVETVAADETETAIRIGNAGLAQHFPKLAAACGKRVQGPARSG